MPMTSSRGAPAPAHRAALVAVYITIFLDILGFGLILPVLPFYARELGASGAELGVLFAAYSMAQLIGSMTLGRLSDRWGRRPVLLASLAGTSAAMFASAVAPTLALLALARFLGGLFAGSIGVGQAYIADVSTAEERPRLMGFLGAAIGGGFVFGPALGAYAVVLGWGFYGAALAAGSLGVANLTLAAFFLHESKTHRRSPGRLDGLRAGLRRAPLRELLLAIFLSTIAFVSMETALAYFVSDRLGVGARGFGLLLTMAGVVSVLVQGGGIGRLTSRLGVRRVAIMGTMLSASGLALLALAPDLGVVIAGIAILALGQGMALPTLSTLLSFEADGDHQGAVLGAGRSMSAAARACGPLLAGWLYDLYATAPLWWGVVLSLSAVWMIRGARDGPDRKESPE